MCCWGQCTCNKEVDSRDTPKFTVLLIHVAATSHTALQDSDLFALVLVRNFFRRYTKIDPARVDEHTHKFKHLEVDSRLEIAFKGKPKGFQAPSYKVFTNDNPNGTVVFDVETRIVQRYITPGCTYKDLEIERTEFLSTYGGELVDTDTSSQAASFPEQSAGTVPPHRYSTYPREGEYMVPTNQKPVKNKSGISHEYANLGKKLLMK
jgi:hypothetical protein